MEKFLRKLKLVKSLKIELEVGKEEFVKKLKSVVDKGETHLLSDVGDLFSSSKNDYRGIVTFEKFEIKKRKKFFDTNMNMATALGTYDEVDGRTIVNVEVNGLSKMTIPFYGFITFVYGLFLSVFLFSLTFKNGFPVFFLPFLLLHASFMYGIPYVMMRRSTRNLAKELEREFHFITK